MATWAKGVDFKNSANTARVGGVGIYGTDGTVEKAYLGVGTEPWNKVGLEVTSSTVSFKGNKVYHAGDKPTPSEIGAAASSHGTHVTWATAVPKANGTAAVGTVARVAREDHVHPLQTTVSGNAGSATKLATARTINGTSFDGTANITTTQWGATRNITIGSTKKSVNGSADVAWSLSEIGAAAASHTHNNYASTSHTHSSLTGAAGSTIAPSTGTGVMRYDYNVSSANAGTLPNSNNANGILTLNTHSGNYYNQLGFSSNGNLYYRAFNGVALDTTTAWKQIAFTNSSITGNAATATTLQTARTINGTSFNGSANITTANWGTARTITISDSAGSNTGSGVSVNGSGNVTLKLPATIAATLSGNASTATKLATARTIALGGVVKGSASFNGSGNITITTTANDIKTITKSLKVTTDWMDTGIAGTNLEDGTYAVQVYVHDGLTRFSEYYSGIMSWFSRTISSSNHSGGSNRGTNIQTCEILLHNAGQSATLTDNTHVYLRTVRVSGGSLKLQIASATAFSSSISVEFNFKKLI